MRNGFRNGKTMIAAACLLGASLLGAAALLGEPSQKSDAWMPMNAAMAELLEEKHGTDERVNGAGGSKRVAGNDTEAGTGEAGTEPGNKTSALLGDNESGSESSSANGLAVEGENDAGGTEGDAGSGVADAAAAGGRDGQHPGEEQSGPVAEASGRIDINRATADQLDDLKGIGPAKAQAIVDDREKNGPFRSVEDLLRVKGIGQKLLASIKESVVALP